MIRGSSFAYLAIALLAWSAGPAARGQAQPKTITLQEARARLLAANPELKAEAMKVAAAGGALRQAWPIPNPELEAEAEDFGGDLPGWNQSQTTLSLSQRLEVGGKRAARVQAATLGQETSAQDLRRKRLDLLAELERRFAELLGAQERLEISEENLATAREVSGAVSALVEAGEVSPIEAVRARGEEGLALIDRDSSAREVAVARLALAQLWGAERPDFESAAGTLAEDALIPSELDAERSMEEQPDLARWRAETGRLEALREEASRSRWPDLTLRFGWRRYAATDEHAYVASVGVPLPLFNRNRGSLIEASARLDEGLFLMRAEEARVRSGYRAARERLSAASREVRLLGERVLPDTRQAYEAVGEGYRRGKFALLDLLEARRTFASARLRYVDALVRLNGAATDLKRLLGTLEEPAGVQP
jgi:cobalt-zinc-cadmium efflux system outer membrane protein